MTGQSAHVDATLLDASGAPVASGQAAIAPGSYVGELSLTPRTTLAPGDYTLRVRAKGIEVISPGVEELRVKVPAAPAGSGARSTDGDPALEIEKSRRLMPDSAGPSASSSKCPRQAAKPPARVFSIALESRCLFHSRQRRERMPPGCAGTAWKRRWRRWPRATTSWKCRLARSGR
jgi:hypothetical protein